MQVYSPSAVREAFGITKDVTLRAWHNTDGLSVGIHRANGHRGYTLADAALVAMVARYTGHDGAGLGFMQHRAAVSLANALRERLAKTEAGYREAWGADMLREMAHARPAALCWPRAGGWEVEFHATRGAWSGALLDRPHGGRPGSALLIDFTELLQCALVQLSVVGARPEDTNA